MDYTAMSAQPLRRQTLVLVTDQFQCERIIKAGRAIAGITHTQLRVFHICAEGRTSDPAALQYLYNSAKENGLCWKSPITAILWAPLPKPSNPPILSMSSPVSPGMSVSPSLYPVEPLPGDQVLYRRRRRASGHGSTVRVAE